MFKIRREQMDAFRRGSIRDFENETVEHVRGSFPERSAELGELGVRDLIRLGIERARGFEFRREPDVCKFIDLMLIFGADFAERCPWAAEILRAPSPVDPTARMALLYARGVEEEP